MNCYRARPLEVRALDLGDGRHVILGEVPRYMASADFLDAFELVGEKRVVAERRQANGHGRPKVKAERRVGGGRRKRNGDTDARQAEGLELLAKGKSVKEVAKKLGVSTAAVYLWRKNAPKANGKAATATKAAAKKEPAASNGDATQRRCRHCGQMTPTTGLWCVHCMENP